MEHEFRAVVFMSGAPKMLDDAALEKAGRRGAATATAGRGSTGFHIRA
jgi:hypothetical protein